MSWYTSADTSRIFEFPASISGPLSLCDLLVSPEAIENTGKLGSKTRIAIDSRFRDPLIAL